VGTITGTTLLWVARFSEFRSHAPVVMIRGSMCSIRTTPAPVKVHPSLAWDNLFDNRGSLQNISILDRVKDRAQDLSKCVGTTDKGKLYEYLTSRRHS